MHGEQEQWKALLTLWMRNSQLASCSLSSPIETTGITKILIRPVVLQKRLSYQVSEQRAAQAFHNNLQIEEACDYLLNHIPKFKQTIAQNSDGHSMHLLISKRAKVTMLLKKPQQHSGSCGKPLLMHNRERNRFFKEGEPVAFLVALGVMSPQGKILTNKKDKFCQINHFLTFAQGLVERLKEVETIRIIDLACGKGYLTFALYHLLKHIHKRPVEIVGIDRKGEVIAACQVLAQELGYDTLHFFHGDIAEFSPGSEAVDMVISLHACDIATDIALERAVAWHAKAILVAPCCQHELRCHVDNKLLAPLLSHNVLRERFAALLTDAVRAELLEAVGYSVQIVEFIDKEHTPKNLLLSAIKAKQGANAKAYGRYLALKDAFCINPKLEHLLKDSL